MRHDDDDNDAPPAALQLLTLLNVSAARPGKRKRSAQLLDLAAQAAKSQRVKTQPSKAVKAGDASLATAARKSSAKGNAVDAQPPTPPIAAPDEGFPATPVSQGTTAQDFEAAQVSEDEDEDQDRDGQAQGGRVDKADAASLGARPDSSAPRLRTQDAFDVHLASEGVGCHAEALERHAAQNRLPDGVVDVEWRTTTQRVEAMGSTVVRQTPANIDVRVAPGKLHAKAIEGLDAVRSHRRPSALQRSLVEVLCSYSDLLFTNTSLHNASDVRQAVGVHLVSHLLKQRRRVLRDNERLAKFASASASTKEGGSTKADSPPELRDQGFTRPSVLVLLPLRNSALAWVETLATMTASPHVDNRARFRSEFSLPAEAVDRLASSESAEKYAPDHRATFRGNIDDNFRLGVKLTRKSLKLYAPLYDADVIVASPLGLRLLIEKERDHDFLSSIDIVVADQLNVVLMQNWDHLKFIFARLSRLPTSSHASTDFSRVRSWHLSARAPHFRQTVLVSPFDDPQLRSLFASLVNVAGRVRTLQAGAPAGGAAGGAQAATVSAAASSSSSSSVAVEEGGWSERDGVMSAVRRGLRQSFTRFECANAVAEPDVRLNHFVNKTLPMLLRSAMSASRTLVVVPSYLDFVRLEDHLRRGLASGAGGVPSYAAISEYSSGGEISRARHAFFSGRKAFLLVTERFHFYRRYVLRGAGTVVFYAPPLHAHFYAEALAMPFARSTRRHALLALRSADDDADDDDDEDEGEGGEGVDASEVNAYTLFCRLDALRLERVVGRETAARMIDGGGGGEGAGAVVGAGAAVGKSTWRFA